MCRFDTKYRIGIATVLLAAVVAADELPLAWRGIGSTVVYRQRAGFSGGPVRSVAFSADGAAVEVVVADGRIYRTKDAEHWERVEKAGPSAAIASVVVDRLPEAGARAFATPGVAYRVYAAGEWLWRSEDQGRSWTNLTRGAEGSVVGEGVSHLSISPLDPGRVVLGTREGVWISSDGGESWASLNYGLPNLHLRRLHAAPRGGRGLVAEWMDGEVVEWQPGAKVAWAAQGTRLAARQQVRWVDAKRSALVLEARGEQLWRSLDGGQQWTDLSGDLAVGRITGIAASLEAGVVYVSGEKGVAFAKLALETGAVPGKWSRLGGEVAGLSTLDVMLDGAANFLYVSVAGEGVFLAHAPHRTGAPAAMSAADFEPRPHAPGGVVAVVGAKVSTATLGGKEVPVLSAASDESQIQIPFEAVGLMQALEVRSDAGMSWRMDLDVVDVAPAIFVDRDGAPLVLDSDTGELLDPAQPLRAGMRIQILMTGLGQVSPAWPAGTPAPGENAPRVIAPVRVWWNGMTLEVTRAELAPGYVGFYVVETKLPPVVDDGTAPLTVEAGGRLSNTILLRVTL